MADGPEFLRWLQEDLGVLDSILPFLLVFTVMFAVLQKTKIIGEGRRQFNTLIALVVSLMVVIPHVTGTYPPGNDVVEIINTALPQVSLMAVIILSALLLIGVFAPGVMFGGTSLGVGLAVVSIGAVIYIFGNATGLWRIPGILNFLQDPDTQAIILIVGVFLAVIWFITKEEGGSGEGMFRGFGRLLEEGRKVIRP